MTSTDLHSRSRVHRERKPTKGASRIDAILAVIDRGLDDVSQVPRYRPDCEQFCTIGLAAEAAAPATAAELTVPGAVRYPAPADARAEFVSGPLTRKEVA
jgi:hypothetical protein